ncbi:hypothetical protein GC197_03590 [bacterium]|nr:hypothetical protein [bacterium]
MIPRPDWREFKRHIHRDQAFTVSADDRATVKKALGVVAPKSFRDKENLCVLPISTMQATSVVLRRPTAILALIDTEQANALEFLLARWWWSERPIFHYIEFMIRAAERLYVDGDIVLALQLARVMNERLAEYVEYHQETFIPRPQYFDELLIELLKAKLPLSFVTGHECGHILGRSSSCPFSPILDWTKATYRADSEGFLLPEVVHRFGHDGKKEGDSVLGIRFAQLMLDRELRQIGECQADIIGAIAATEIAIERGVTARDLFVFLFQAMQSLEMISVLHELLSTTPRGKKACAISMRPTNLVARLSLFMRFLLNAHVGKVPLLTHHIEFWASLPSELVNKIRDDETSGICEMLAHRISIFARGGIIMGLSGELPPRPNLDLVEENWGPLAGQGYFLSAHGNLPAKFCRIEENHEWSADEASNDPVAIGFASAVRDITVLSSSESRFPTVFSRNDILRDGKDSDFVEVLRSARSQVVSRELNPNWLNGFDLIL